MRHSCLAGNLKSHQRDQRELGVEELDDEDLSRVLGCGGYALSTTPGLSAAKKHLAGVKYEDTTAPVPMNG
jgi:hypothetical protein